MTRILVDCDGVMADFTSEYLNVLHLQTGRDVPHTAITEFDFAKCGICTPDEDKEVWAHIKARPGAIRGLRAYPAIGTALADLRELGDVVCVTGPVWGSSWAEERFQWLAEYGFSAKTVVFASNKALIAGDVLIDDALHNLQDWRLENHRGFGICVDRPWNRHGTQHPRVMGLAGAAAYLTMLRSGGHF
jgi:5'(3')-deoxyribonucleotidase